MQIYHGFIHVHLCNLVSIWGSANANVLKQVQVLQNRALKLVKRLPRLTPTLSLYTEHFKDILPLKSLYNFYSVKHVKKCINEETLSNIDFTFKRRIDNLRDALKLERPAVRTGIGRLQVEFSGTSFFNSLPVELRTTVSTEAFCKRVKSFLLQPEQVRKSLF